MMLGLIMPCPMELLPVSHDTARIQHQTVACVTALRTSALAAQAIEQWPSPVMREVLGQAT